MPSDPTPPIPHPTPQPAPHPTPHAADLLQIPQTPRLPGITSTLRGSGLRTEAQVEARRAYVGPLFDYCARHSIVVIQVVRRAALRIGAGHFPRNRLMRVKQGTGVTPPWFVAAVCREIGQPIEVVMGEEWVQRHFPAQTPDLPVARPNDKRRAS